MEIKDFIMVPQAITHCWKTVLRPLLMVAATLALLLGTATAAQAQWAWGWTGWGATPGGRVARGLGAYATGLGELRLDTARARAIHTRNAMAWNEYLYRSELRSRRRYLAQRLAQDKSHEQAQQALHRRHLYNPTPQDIEDGSALNAILYQFSNPDVHPSIMKQAARDLTLSGQTVGKIPFKFTHKGVAISLKRLLAEGKGWPEALKTEAMATNRKQYEDIVNQMLEVPQDQPIPDKLINKARLILSRMREYVEEAELSDDEAADAIRSLKSHAGMIKMLDEPRVRQAVEKAQQVEQISLPNLIGFMHLYNLQFAPAKTIEEKKLYRSKLYPMMGRLREQVAQQFGGQLPGSLARTAPESTAAQQQQQGQQAPAAMFETFEWSDLGMTNSQTEQQQSTTQ